MAAQGRETGMVGKAPTWLVPAAEGGWGGAARADVRDLQDRRKAVSQVLPELAWEETTATDPSQTSEEVRVLVVAECSSLLVDRYTVS